MNVTRRTMLAMTACACTAFAVFGAEAEKKPLKVLMIGNSYSVCNLQQMPQVAADRGCGLDLASLCIGGCPMERHAKNMAKADSLSYSLSWNRCGKPRAEWPELAACRQETTAKDRKTKQDVKVKQANVCKVLAAEKWDVVTIQQASHFSFKPESYAPWGDQMVETIRRLAPQAEIVVQETWSDQPESKRLAKWNLTTDSMYEALHASYAAFAKKHGLKVIPTGTAVQFARGVAPLQAEKGNPHLCGTGVYLQGLVWTAKLFGVDVTACVYAPRGMSPDVAKALRQAAMRAVKGEVPPHACEAK